jgi:hypothetical protein
MQALMLSRRGKLLSRLLAKPSFAGTGLLERMRSTTFALLGITAAMGLGLVAVASQQSWPLLPGAPIPGVPWSGEVEEATVVAAAPIASTLTDRGLADGTGTGTRNLERGDRQPSGAGGDSQLSDSRTLATAPPQRAPDPAPEVPSGSPPPVSSSPAPTAPSQSPNVAPAPEPSSSPASSPATPASPPALSAAKEQDNIKGKETVKDKSPGGKGGKPTKAATGSPPSKPEKADKPDAAVTTAPPAPVPSPVVKPDESGYDEKEEAAGYSPGHGKDRGQAYEHGK